MLKYGVIILVLVTHLSFIADAQSATVARWVDENGVVHFGDVPPRDQSNADEVEIGPANGLAVPSNTVSRDLSTAASTPATATKRSAPKTVRVVKQPKKKLRPRKKKAKKAW